MAESLTDGEENTDANMSAVTDSTLTYNSANNAAPGEVQAIDEHATNTNKIQNMTSKEANGIDRVDSTAINEVKRTSTGVSTEGDFVYPPMRRVLVVFSALCLAIFLVVRLSICNRF